MARLSELFAAAAATGITADRIELDVSIARGLDYYTGTIYETFLTDDSAIGSVCSGGRYDNLAALFTNQRLPGVGASLGVDRLLAALENLGKIDSASTPAPVRRRGTPFRSKKRTVSVYLFCLRFQPVSVSTSTVVPSFKVTGSRRASSLPSIPLQRNSPSLMYPSLGNWIGSSTL